MQGFDTTLANFIVLEGIDGAGTTTQVKLLSERLTAGSVPHFPTFEPTDGTVGKLIRTILRGQEHTEPGTLALLFAADRHEHVFRQDQGILSHHNKSEIVISDRYLFSSVAYQSIDIASGRVMTLNQEFPLPSHLFFLDIPIMTAMERLADRQKREIFEVRDFLEKVIRSYDLTLSLFEASPMKIHRIDGTLPVADVFQKIWEIILTLPILKA